MDKYKELLGKTLEVQSESKNEKRMKKFVREYLKGIGLKPEHDNKGNIYCHKGDKKVDRPFIIAHLDTVHSISGNISVHFDGTYFFAMDNYHMTQAGVGGDDKVGVWAALSAITEFDNISIALFVQEEIGCIGSYAANMKQFSNANWLAQLDRRGFEDFITGRLASDDFEEDMGPIAEAYGMAIKNQSTITDVNALYTNKVGVSSVNISSGYYKPHMATEVVIWEDAANALELVFAMIIAHGDKKYPHLPPKPKPPKVKNLPATTVGYKMRGTESNSTTGYENLRHGRVKYVKSKMRMWNNFFNCYEWRDAAGNLVYYEGSGLKAQHFSRLPKHVREKDREEPPYQEAIPYNGVVYDMTSVYSNIDIFGVDVDNDLDIDTSKEESEDEYYNRMAREYERRDTGYDANEEFDNVYIDGTNKYNVKEHARLAKKRDADEEAKNYHDFEAEYASTDVNNDDAHAALSLARKQIDSVLFMYSYTFLDFLQGRIPDEVVKNISSSLHYDHGNTLSFYEQMFCITGTYDSADSQGCFTNFQKDSFHNPPVPY